MRFIVRKRTLPALLLVSTLLGSVFADLVFATDQQAADEPSSQTPERRALPAPLDPLFPGSEYLGPTPLIGVPDTDPEYPLEKALWSAFPALKANRIKVYGWVNAGFDFSTSNKSNIPESYAIVPNKLELDQAVVRIERLPDTVQRDSLFALAEGLSTSRGRWCRSMGARRGKR